MDTLVHRKLIEPENDIYYCFWRFLGNFVVNFQVDVLS